jgi:hypothetical protein
LRVAPRPAHQTQKSGVPRLRNSALFLFVGAWGGGWTAVDRWYRGPRPVLGASRVTYGGGIAVFLLTRAMADAERKRGRTRTRGGSRLDAPSVPLVKREAIGARALFLWVSCRTERRRCVAGLEWANGQVNGAVSAVTGSVEPPGRCLSKRACGGPFRRDRRASSRGRRVCEGRAGRSRNPTRLSRAV